MAAPRFVGSDIYRTIGYPPNHPLAIPRVAAVMDLAGALGWLPSFEVSPAAATEQLARFHDPDYLSVLQTASAGSPLTAELCRRHKLGGYENPVFAGMFRRAATACGGSLLAAALVRDGGVACNLAGGTHHGRPDRASGFCYLNDPVMGILALLDQGLERVMYVDTDAHHGDGVEDAFRDDPRVLTVSVHEQGRWPFTGTASLPLARNIPVPPGFNDSEMAAVVADALVPLAEAFRPQAVVITCGADALADDPLSRLALSNRALWAAVGALVTTAPRAIVLGGGGYNPWSVARCWTGLWGMLSGRAFEGRLPTAAKAVLGGLDWDRDEPDERPERWFTTLCDDWHPGVVRESVRQAIRAATLDLSLLRITRMP